MIPRKSILYSPGAGAWIGALVLCVVAYGFIMFAAWEMFAP